MLAFAAGNGGGGMACEAVLKDESLLPWRRFKGDGGSSRSSGATRALYEGDLGKGMPTRSRRANGLMGVVKAAKELKRRILESRVSLEEV